MGTISGEPNIKSLPIPPAVELGIQIFCVWQKKNKKQKKQQNNTHTHTREIFSRDDLSLDFQPVLNWGFERNVILRSKT